MEITIKLDFEWIEKIRSYKIALQEYKVTKSIRNEKYSNGIKPYLLVVWKGGFD